MTAGLEQVRETVGAILEKYQHDKGSLVSILQDTQAEIGYLAREALSEVSTGLDVPMSRVYGVATFFRAFSLTPRGRHQINVCMGTACHVRGAVRILEAIERETGIKSGETSEDLRFSLDTVNCVGACALGPIVIADEKYSGEMTVDRVKPLLAAHE
ncbi:MAG TPA: NAD(P)H-dependent oxidoreductase subunit E [Dehalococcoidia bacterium]|nr:NAD(P)H-dependent oxidoreductase subunit E [Dehalococcoidia bacterium]